MKFVVSLTVNNNVVPVSFFNSLESATSFVTNSSNPSFQIFQCNSDGGLMNGSYNYSLTNYGRGYLLTTPQSNPLYGEKYFNSETVSGFEGEGFWNTNQNGWFFRKQNLDALNSFVSNSGASHSEEDELDELLDDLGSNDLSNMLLEQHGKGFLLYPDEEDPNYGQKYFLNGWWMPKYKAWFFKSEFYDQLLSMGAQTSSEPTSDHPLDDTEYAKHGRGYLVYPNQNHPSYGAKYYHDGWWMPKHNAWFFKDATFQALNV